jgi:hypothetical protein
MRGEFEIGFSRILFLQFHNREFFQISSRDYRNLMMVIISNVPVFLFRGFTLTWLIGSTQLLVESEELVIIQRSALETQGRRAVQSENKVP